MAPMSYPMGGTRTEAPILNLDGIESLPAGPLDDDVQASLIRTLRETDEASVRNAAAIAMADHEVHGGAGSLIEQIASPKTLGRRGTLLYALEEMGVHVPLDLLLQIVMEDGYEGREQALDLIDAGLHACDPATMGAACRRFEAWCDRQDAATRAAVDSAREVAAAAR
jgi:hypothetical protein